MIEKRLKNSELLSLSGYYKQGLDRKRNNNIGEYQLIAFVM